MEFRILGPLEVRSEDGRVLALGGAKPRGVLALLLLHANQPVRAEQLAVDVWGVDAPANSIKTIQVHVSRLRRALEDESLLLTTPAGYRLRVRTGELDAARFDELVADGQEALAAGDPRRAAALLREALGLWRGPALGGVEFEPFAQNAIARLEEQRLAALEARVEADLAAGSHAQLIAELQQLSVQYPTRERLAGQLMLALYRCGRAGDAAAVYRSARHRLADELGIEPGRELRELELKVLNQDPALHLPRPATPADGGVPTGLAAPPAERGSDDDDTVRKTVTVLVASLRSQTRHADPEVRQRLMKLAREEAARVIEGHGGHVLRGRGAELVGVFGLSRIREDDALHALTAAVQLRAEMTALLDGEPGELSLHVGLDTGVVAAGAGEEPVGDPVEGAAELARTADDGAILLSEATRRFAPDAIRVGAVDHGTWVLEDVIPNAPSVRRRHNLPMIDRADELAIALRAFERATVTRSAQLLTVEGDAGLGKSRLAEEVRHCVEGRAKTLVAHCGAYGDGTALWPLRGAIADLTGDGNSDTVRRLLGQAEDADAIADLVLAGLGLVERAADQERVPWALRRLLETVAESKPLVLIVEDAHAAEPPLLDLLEYLVEWLTAAPVFVLCLVRPEFLDGRRSWPRGPDGVMEVKLARLSDDESSQLLESLTERQPISPVSRDRVLRAAEGNPLFLEQMVAMDSEDDGDGYARVPATIQTLLAARLDRLEHGERAVIERAAVIGRRFAAGDVVELMPTEERAAARQHLRALVHRGLITPERSTGDDVLRFHHILIRDVAYAGCPKSLRSRVHEEHANRLARRAQTVDEAIGYHLEQAYRYRYELRRVDEDARDLARRAGQRLGAAGSRALARGDAGAAGLLLRRAANLFEAGDDVRADVLLELGSALSDSGDFPAAGPFLRAALDAARGPGAETLAARASVELSNQRLFAEPHPNVDAMHREARAAIAVLERKRDESGLARAWNHIGSLHWTRLEIAAAEQALERALEHARRAGDARERSEAFNILLRATVVGPCVVDVGIRRCEDAREGAAEAVALVAIIDITLAVLEAMRMRIDVAREHYQGARQLLQEHGLGLRMAGLEVYPAMVELLAGDPGLAEPYLERACADLERVGERARLPTAIAFRARVLCAMDEYDDALRLTHLSEKLNYRHDLASQILWSGTRARVLARTGDARESERLARLSVEVACRTDAAFLTAAALTDLADVLSAVGRPDAAMGALDDAIALHDAKRNQAGARFARALRHRLAG
jgi:DNA-binding SARP family transcriptional activator/class 3 adenylate cyclase